MLAYPRRSNGRIKHGVTRSIIDEFHSWDIEGEEMKGESCVTRSIIDELDSSDIQRDQIEGQTAITRSIIE